MFRFAKYRLTKQPCYRKLRLVKRNDPPVTFWVADDSWEDEFFTVNHDAGVRHLSGFCGACLLGVSKKESYICRSCECRVDTD